MSKPKELTGPDFTHWFALADLADGGMVLGHAEGEHVLLTRRGEEVFAVGAACTHYGALLTKGIAVGDTVRCPWHHAHFDIRTGEAVTAPAFNPLPCWNVERRGDEVRVAGRRQAPPRPPAPATVPESVVIVGAGAAGVAAADMLRREGYTGPVTLIGAEPHLPVDRPNLSKDYLAGKAPEDWLWILPQDFYARNQLTLLSGVRATAIDPARRHVVLSNGDTLGYGALLLATGAEPVHLPIPGTDLPHVHYLRTLEDSRGIVAATANAKRAVVIGASFIGLEVAASLRARGLEVHVVAPDERPLERIMGPEVGDFVRELHEKNGVQFHLRTRARAIDANAVTLEDGTTLAADLVAIGIGVRPAVRLAEEAGLDIDNGVLVDKFLQTSAPGIYAAGDIARYPDVHTGERVRIEHWNIAQRQGQTAARNMLGKEQRFDAVPFFWSEHYDVIISYVGHAKSWDRIEIDGSLAGRDCTLRYRQNGKVLAVVTIFRDRESLQVEAEMEAEAAAQDA